ncbi:hypothetical protein IMW75_11090 [Pseudomonas gregormendelii]|uniref:Uncharacterized protein n=1 Tax=Pseudomonas gregormendelii TaxID=1628277 RepID=A0ABS3AG13_9PSED|nr:MULTISPECIES: hypothetical protein [Pseudomonas]KJH78969.1 hypothetical protein UB23_00560 [Pseudomonas sp. ES3-33]MBN3965823.1 hypothetical protein [Pseudomonas gregormendelii]
MNGGVALFEQQISPFDRNPESVLDGRSQVSIIRPTSGAVETENSLVNNELRSFDGQLLQVIEAQKKLKKRC